MALELLSHSSGREGAAFRRESERKRDSETCGLQRTWAQCLTSLRVIF
jgi:hypothetical protein